MPEPKCLRVETIDNIQDNVKLLQKEVKELQQDRAETRVYVKQIFERIEDLKGLFKSSQENSIAIQEGISEANDSATKMWQPVVIELIKTISTVAAVIAGIKFMG